PTQSSHQLHLPFFPTRRSSDLEVQLEERLHDRGGDGVVAAARAQRGHRALVVAAREPELVGGQAGVADRWLGDRRHASTPPSWRSTPSVTWWALSGRPP